MYAKNAPKNHTPIRTKGAAAAVVVAVCEQTKANTQMIPIIAAIRIAGRSARILGALIFLTKSWVF